MSDTERHRRSPYLTLAQHQMCETVAGLIVEELRQAYDLPIAKLTNQVGRLVEIAETLVPEGKG